MQVLPPITVFLAPFASRQCIEQRLCIPGYPDRVVQQTNVFLNSHASEATPTLVGLMNHSSTAVAPLIAASAAAATAVAA